MVTGASTQSKCYKGWVLKGQAHLLFKSGVASVQIIWAAFFCMLLGEMFSHKAIPRGIAHPKVRVKSKTS
jgi:hypothetical protein